MRIDPLPYMERPGVFEPDAHTEIGKSKERQRSVSVNSIVARKQSRSDVEAHFNSSQCTSNDGIQKGEAPGNSRAPKIMDYATRRTDGVSHFQGVQLPNHQFCSPGQGSDRPRLLLISSSTVRSITL